MLSFYVGFLHGIISVFYVLTHRQYETCSMLRGTMITANEFHEGGPAYVHFTNAIRQYFHSNEAQKASAVEDHCYRICPADDFTAHVGDESC